MHQFNKILIGIAFSPNLKQNIYEGIRLSNMFNAQLVCVHVGARTQKKEEKIQGILKEGPTTKNEVKVLFQTGSPVDVILDVCQKENVDLLILGALQKENIYKYYIGSIARKLTRNAPCSVLLLIKHSIVRVPCNHIVVNGLKDPKTAETIDTSFYVAQAIGCKRITIVEEIMQSEIDVKINDDTSLRRATIAKERISNREDIRVKDLLNCIDEDKKEGISIKTQSIFGKRGYSIGHYARVVRADLLIMNAPNKTNLLDRIFPHDIEYILSELPTDVLIVK
ncbi:universal stress protein [Flavicella sediminum]|uniref:universal stress protein n=1 Tax=Flavicella sediminum TaxID=2585141 RepID=UPI0011240CA5|nr:universal stress protein [Flavicella sediminum]